jgi:hypothetical protein
MMLAIILLSFLGIVVYEPFFSTIPVASFTVSPPLESWLGILPALLHRVPFERSYLSCSIYLSFSWFDDGRIFSPPYVKMT